MIWPNRQICKREPKKLTIYSWSYCCIDTVIFCIPKILPCPRETDAADQMHVRRIFGKKEWDKAIKGDQGYPGFEKIISDYSSTKAANLAYFLLRYRLFK